jgi:hypothetical protein
MKIFWIELGDVLQSVLIMNCHGSLAKCCKAFRTQSGAGAIDLGVRRPGNGGHNKFGCHTKVMFGYSMVRLNLS